jgi:glycosyltransferase involved in cell wall biosynthesis
MNILFLNSLSKSKWGGGEKWMIFAGAGLANRGHKVTIACINNSVIEKKAVEKGLSTWHFSISAEIAFWKAGVLKSFLKSQKVDVLICCQNKDVKIGARAARQLGIKAIYARQGIQNLKNKKKYIRPFTQYIDGIITNTLSIKNIYDNFGWFPDHFIHVIYNGVELPSEVDDIDLHSSYQIPDKCKVIFSAGRLDYQKGFDLLIEVAALAKEQNLNWQLLIAGEGKLKSELNAMASQKGVSEFIKFIGFSNNIPALLKACDVFVLPSRYEGMPNALLEAMAMGKASVATNVNGASELVEDGTSGFLVDSENTGQIFAKLKELLSNETLRLSMGNEALLRVKNNFTFDKMTDDLEQLLKKQILISDDY